MILEQKTLSPTEKILFFPTPIPLIGTFFSADSSAFELIENLKSTTLAKTILLTKDFIYLQAINSQSLEDLYLIAISELEDFISQKTSHIATSENLETKIKLILKLIIAPFLNKDGGDIEFHSVQDDTVFVKFLGKCNGCPYATRTLKEKVEKNLTSYIPEIKKASLV